MGRASFRRLRGGKFSRRGGLKGLSRRRLAAIHPPTPRRHAVGLPNDLKGRQNGAIAQLGERFNGIEEVVGSIPSGSTKKPQEKQQG
jgi:hypothetical protein